MNCKYQNDDQPLITPFLLKELATIKNRLARGIFGHIHRYICGHITFHPTSDLFHWDFDSLLHQQYCVSEVFVCKDFEADTYSRNSGLFSM